MLLLCISRTMGPPLSCAQVAKALALSCLLCTVSQTQSFVPAPRCASQGDTCRRGRLTAAAAAPVDVGGRAAAAPQWATGWHSRCLNRCLVDSFRRIEQGLLGGGGWLYGMHPPPSLLERGEVTKSLKPAPTAAAATPQPPPLQKLVLLLMAPAAV